MKIMDKAKVLVAGLAVLAMSVVALPASAASGGSDLGTGVVCPSNAPQNALKRVESMSECGMEEGNTLMSTLQVIINVVIGVIGFIAVVVIIIGGVQYTTSAGASDKVKKAKDTIMYGIIGLVVALLAYAIVNFILSSVFTQS